MTDQPPSRPAEVDQQVDWLKTLIYVFFHSECSFGIKKAVGLTKRRFFYRKLKGQFWLEIHRNFMICTLVVSKEPYLKPTKKLGPWAHWAHGPHWAHWANWA